MRRTSRLLSLRLAPSRTGHLSSLARPVLTNNRTPSYPIPRRPYHASTPVSKGLSPSHEDPEPPNNADGEASSHPAEPANISTDEFHDISDQYIDSLVLKLEEMAEDASEKMEVEYSVCVSQFLEAIQQYPFDIVHQPFALPLPLQSMYFCGH